MDFMNLNQSAHGDREFGYIETRLGLARKIVVGPLGGSGRRRADRRLDPRRLRLARGTRRCEVARFGDNMREVAVTEGDKVEAQIRLGVAVNGYGVGDLADAVAGGSGRGGRRPGRRVRGELRRSRPSLRAGGADREALREAARIEAGLRAFLEEGGFGAFTDTFEDLDGLRQLPGHRRPAADGRRLRLRRRGRLEDGGPGPRCSRSWPRACRAAPPSWRTTPTTSIRPGRWSWAPTCSRSAPRSPRASPLRDPPALDRRQGRSGPARLRRAARVRPRGRADGHGRPLPAHRQRDRPGRGHRRRCRACRSAAPSGSRARIFATATEAWLIGRRARITRS